MGGSCGGDLSIWRAAHLGLTVIPKHSELVTSQFFLKTLSRAVRADAEMTVSLASVCAIPM